MFFLGGIGIVFALISLSLICFGIPVIIAVFVYKDASKRVDCTPWLWALVAALVPSFIGLVIYLIIRNDYPIKPAYVQSMEDNAGRTVDNEHSLNTGTGLPGWAKALIIIVSIVIVLCVVAISVSIVYSIITGAQNCDPTPYVENMY